MRKMSLKKSKKSRSKIKLGVPDSGTLKSYQACAVQTGKVDRVA
jgi:hypothetical protein